MLQCVAVRCSVLQCVAVGCSVLIFLKPFVPQHTEHEARGGKNGNERQTESGGKEKEPDGQKTG